MATGDVLRMSITGFFNGTEIVNTWHYKDVSGGSTEFFMATTCADFYTQFWTQLQNCLTTDYILYSIRGAVVAGPGLGRVFTQIYSGITGGNAPSVAQVPEICISIKRSTGYASRANRGRLFLGPVDNIFLTDPEKGEVDTTNSFLLLLAGTTTAIFTTQTVGLVPCLVSKLFVPSAQLLYSGIAPGTVHRRKRRFRGAPV
jgi:hypothetical protein